LIIEARLGFFRAFFRSAFIFAIGWALVCIPGQSQQSKPLRLQFSRLCFFIEDLIGHPIRFVSFRNFVSLLHLRLRLPFQLT